MLASFPKVPNVASESPKIRFRLPHCCLTPSLQGTPANTRINLILSTTTVTALHLRRHYMGVSSFKFSWWAQKDACVLFCVRALRGHPRSLILAVGTNRKRVCDFLLIINSNLGPILVLSYLQRYCGFSDENI